MRLFIHALGASAGGGLTYLRNLLPHLAARRDLTAIVLTGAAAAEISASDNVELLDGRAADRGTLSRFWWEQRRIPALVRNSRADVLLSVGNFAVWNSPVPQILLSRNSLYTSHDFSADLIERREYRLYADTQFKGWIARRSIGRAQLTLAPSEAFARELRCWSGRKVQFLHHGFDYESFTRESRALPTEVEVKLREVEGSTRLLFVSHYNYYRNFETLLRGMAEITRRHPSRKVRLLLTCELAAGKNPGAYRTERVRALLRDLQIDENVVQLGAIPYHQLHHLYRACDLYVTPAYTETFSHPLVEAMACGLPIVASDLAVHREITDGAALFFEKFSPTDLADKVLQLIDSPSLQSEIRQRGLRRSGSFSWKDHTDRLVEMARSLVGSRTQASS